MRDSYKAYIDGSCAPFNPGGTAVSKFILSDYMGILVSKERNVIGTGPQMSNNVAEYCALIALLEYVKKNIINGPVYTPDKSLVIYSDSTLVVHQINDDAKIKNGLYKEAALLAKERWQELETKIKLRIVYIPRGQNFAHNIK